MKFANFYKTIFVYKLLILYLINSGDVYMTYMFYSMKYG